MVNTVGKPATRCHSQVYKDQAYDTPNAIPHEGSERVEDANVARPGKADDEVEKPKD